MKVFVTVGTTKFDKLLKRLLDLDVQKALKAKGYTELTIQYGNSDFVDPRTELGFEELEVVESFHFKPSLEKYIEEADLVIAHAGAGTCLEVLNAEPSKPLIVVINEDLMDNHQHELAEKLAEAGYLRFCKLDTLKKLIELFDPASIVPYQPGDPKIFANYLDEALSREGKLPIKDQNKKLL